MNILYGRWQYGRWIYAGSVKTGTAPPGPGGSGDFKPDSVLVIAYNQDGTKSAVFANDTEDISFSDISFEIAETGCSAAKITFKELPTFIEINFGQRIDIHLFNDPQPWYSGYVLTRPDTGGTDETFTIELQGFYNQLSTYFFFGKTYENQEIAAIVRDLVQELEDHTGIIYDSTKIYNVGYTIDKIVFDGVSAKEAFDQLCKFAPTFVFGVDSTRDFYFNDRTEDINEQARFWVGTHLNEFSPTVDISKITNYAKIKTQDSETNGTYITTVQDTESQTNFGLKMAVWTLPTAYTEADAEQWGNSEIARLKDPAYSAKIKGLNLEYPNADESFNVRKLSTIGKTAIYDLDGTLKTYAITKLKYSISSDKGITCDMEVGVQPFRLSDYLLNIERNARNNELLEQYKQEA